MTFSDRQLAWVRELLVDLGYDRVWESLVEFGYVDAWSGALRENPEAWREFAEAGYALIAKSRGEIE